jgi:hypothetical protein
MNWDAVGAVAELLGAVGVILSLVYLAAQIKQNTRASRASTIQQWAVTSSVEKQSVIGDAEFAKILVEGGSESAKLDAVEQVQFRLYWIQVFNTFEFLFLQREFDTIDQVFFESKLPAYKAILALPGVRTFWEENADLNFDPRFRAFVEKEVLSSSHE